RAQVRIAAFAHQRQVGRFGVDVLDVDRAGDETLLQHQQAEDRLVHAGRAQRVAGERLGRGERWHRVAEYRTHRAQLGDIADRGRGAVRVDVVDAAIQAFDGQAH